MRVAPLARTIRRDAFAALALFVAAEGGTTLAADGAFNHGVKLGGIQPVR